MFRETFPASIPGIYHNLLNENDLIGACRPARELHACRPARGDRARIAELGEPEEEDETLTGADLTHQHENSVGWDLRRRYLKADACRSGSHASTHGGVYA